MGRLGNGCDSYLLPILEMIVRHKELTHLGRTPTGIPDGLAICNLNPLYLSQEYSLVTSVSLFILTVCKDTFHHDFITSQSCWVRCTHLGSKTVDGKSAKTCI